MMLPPGRSSAAARAQGQSFYLRVAPALNSAQCTGDPTYTFTQAFTVRPGGVHAHAGAARDPRSVGFLRAPRTWRMGRRRGAVCEGRTALTATL